MRRGMMVLAAGLLAAGLMHCGGEDPDVRRGNIFFKGHQWYEAIQAYEKAWARDPKIFDEAELRENFKNAYYYYGGTRESGGSLEAALKYYEKGFDLIPGDMNIAAKLADYYQAEEDYEKSVKYLGKLVELESQAADSKTKWEMLGRDYYAMGYALYMLKKYDESLEAFQQSLKASPGGAFAAKSKRGIETVNYEMKKKK